MEAVERHYDPDVRWRVIRAELDLESQLERWHTEDLAPSAGQRESLRHRSALLQQEEKERLAPLHEEREGLWRAREGDLHGRAEGMRDMGALVGKDAQELGAGL